MVAIVLVNSFPAWMSIRRRAGKSRVRDFAMKERVETLMRSMPGRFTSGLHSERVAARLGLWLGVSFTVAFVTGLFSHFMQHPPPPAGLAVPAGRALPDHPGTARDRRAGHDSAAFAKLWTVYPKLWQWPPFRSLSHAVERALVLVLVGASLFQLLTGLLNISYAYLWPFSFPVAHYWTAYLLLRRPAHSRRERMGEGTQAFVDAGGGRARRRRSRRGGVSSAPSPPRRASPSCSRWARRTRRFPGWPCWRRATRIPARRASRSTSPRRRRE